MQIVLLVAAALQWVAREIRKPSDIVPAQPLAPLLEANLHDIETKA